MKKTPTKIELTIYDLGQITAAIYFYLMHNEKIKEETKKELNELADKIVNHVFNEKFGEIICKHLEK